MWRLNGNVAQLENNLLSASIDASSLEGGIVGLKWFDDGKTKLVPGPMLKILIPREPTSPPPKLVELYVRQQDLVATYEELAQPRVRPQVYWREISSSTGNPYAGLEVILSVQTSVLDSRPTIWMESQLGQSEIFTLRMSDSGILKPVSELPTLATNGDASPACVFLSRLADGKRSYLEMAFPADFHDASVSMANEGSTASVRHLLHTERLEKGVIRRCRIRSLLIPTDGEKEIAAECLKEFLESPLPLTT